MFESLFVAAALGAGGPVPVPLPAAPAPQPAEESRPRIYLLKTASAQLAAPAVTADLHAAGLPARLSFDQPSNSVIVQGSAAAYARVAEFLPRFEETSRGELRVFRLQHVSADAAARVACDRLTAAGVAVQLVPAVRANALVVSGSPAELVQFTGVVTAIDQVPTPAAVAPAPREVPVLTASYHLRNVAAGDVAAPVGAALGTGREVRVGVRPAENQLVVTGSPATHARAAALLAELDRPVPQVLVQAMFAEVPVAFLADCGLTASGGCFSLKGRELALFHTAFRNYPGRTVLSRPQIQTGDNQTGHVRVGQDFPVGTGDAQFVGVSLRVTPRVMPEGKILLRVEPQVSAVAAPPVVAQAGATTFPVNVQTVQTTVLVPAGETVVLVGPGTGGGGKATALLLVLTPTVVRP